ncbi:TPA: hypothetical protein OXB05_002697 [Clostridioides difficile]|nr:hypothetical protein [Clostridioides difficile]EGT3828370.1 hypothetical protein [Clostridioides difficile]EGT4891767.1 hypothetical protein [Clostridioides difficile]EKS6800477.1 hypothetical protein [Clostridioides difficile]EKS7167069.1 hypothetical protein [Clostridioides difficile]
MEELYMDGLFYERFVRSAFSIKLNNLIDRSEDLGGLADAAIFRAANNLHELNEIKISTGYAIAIFNNEILEHCNVSNEDSNMMTELFDRSLVANSRKEIVDIIREYEIYRERYFTFNWNR